MKSWHFSIRLMAKVRIGARVRLRAMLRLRLELGSVYRPIDVQQNYSMCNAIL